MPETPLADWLALREAIDHAARSQALTRAVVAALPALRPLSILDLGTGTGSNIRYLSPRLPAPQSWCAVDRDSSLLARLPSGVTTRCSDLGALEDSELFDGVHLVTASALLDLVSAEWIARLAARCRDAGTLALFVLTYDGSTTCHPADVDDGFVLERFNQHQRSSNKGFGPAAGPDAAVVAAGSFAASGYRVRRDRSDWRLTPDLVDLQTSLIQGWAHAVGEVAPREHGRIDAWLSRRLEHVQQRRSHIVVGHVDLAAF